MLKLTIRPGEALKIGDYLVIATDKHGLRVDAPRDVPIVRVPRSELQAELENRKISASTPQ